MATASDGRVGLLVDVLVVVVLAGLLVAIHHLVPPAARNGLALAYDEPDPFHAFTAAYVHLDGAHLRGNVTAFLLACTVAALLAHLADEPRWFRLSGLAYLTIVPVAVGLTTATLVDASVVGRGFSSVVAAFVGFVLVSPGVLLRRSYGFERWVGWNAVAALTVVVGAEILWASGIGLSPTSLAVLAVGLLLVLGLFVTSAVSRSPWPADRAGWVDLAGALVTVGLVLAVVSAFVVVLFPAEIVSGDSVTNVLGHYLGLVSGAVVAVWGARYWATAEP